MEDQVIQVRDIKLPSYPIQDFGDAPLKKLVLYI